MKQEDSDIKTYFETLKQFEAKHIEIPAFNMPKKSPKRKRYYYLVPSAIAATLLLLFGLSNDVQKTENETLLINLTTTSNTNTDDLIKEESSITNWESPTRILIQEFEDE